MKLKAILAIMACIMLGCNGDKSSETASSSREISKVKWLEGEWQNLSDSVYVYESWAATNDSTFSGRGYVIIGSDTVSSEIMSLEERNGTVNYIPTVRSQNEGQSVSFTMSSSDSGRIVFENPTHDFPQKITYRKVNEDSLVAEISGNINGKDESQEFPLKRKQ